MNYAHILEIDRHRPWTDPDAAALLARIGPRYVTHELAGAPGRAQARAVRRQMKTIERGAGKP